jgi:regulator of sirC expression with transglutaminase-like and TPR domain
MAVQKIPPDLEALISLLDDPDAEAFRHVKEKISSMGPSAVGPLEAAWEQSFDPIFQTRIEDLVHQIQLDKLFQDFSQWVSSGAKDLLAGYMLVTRFQYPDLNEDKVVNQVDHMVRDIWLELNNNLTALEKVRVLNHIIFLIYKFEGGSTKQLLPENYYLNILLESRQGTPLSLGLLYLICAKKLGIPMMGVDLPQHFILSYTNQVDDANIAGMDALEVQFYINPFARGAVFGRKELSEYLKQTETEPEESFYLPCSNLQILRRLITELQASYRAIHKEQQAKELDRFLEGLS